MKTGADLLAAMTALSEGGFSSVAPSRMDVGGRDYVVATDAWCAVFVPSAARPDITVAAPTSRADALRKYLVANRVSAASYQADVLARFSDVGREHQPCSVCDDKREVTCEECDGAGTSLIGSFSERYWNASTRPPLIA